MTTLIGRRRTDPRAALAQLARPARSASGSRSTRSIQGTAADIIKIAMVRCRRARCARRGSRSRLVLQIHDELLFEGPEGEAEAVTELARREMVDAFELDPPLAVDVGVGPDWLAAK